MSTNGICIGDDHIKAIIVDLQPPKSSFIHPTALTREDVSKNTKSKTRSEHNCDII